jgi:hypothetical protein
MTEASLAKAGPGFCGGGDFLARRGLGLDFLRRRESFFGGMRAFIPEGITLRRAGGFDKRSENRKWKREKRTEKKRKEKKSFTTEDTEGTEKRQELTQSSLRRAEGEGERGAG